LIFKDENQYSDFYSDLKSDSSMMAVKDLMQNPITISKNSKISDAITKMLVKNISRLIVVDEVNPIGIVTEKDIGLFLLQDKTDRKLVEIPISEIVKNLFLVDESTTVKDCANIMLDKQISSLVIGSNKKIHGIVTKTDLTKYFADNYPSARSVGEFMSTVYFWSYSNDPLFKVLAKMIDRKISRIILRNQNEKPEGILSFRDLFKIALNLGNEEVLEDNTMPDVSVIFSRKGFISESGFGGISTASQVMKGKIISVNYDDDLAEACKILLKNKINGVGVLSSRGTLAGILSKTDVMLAIATIT